MRARIAEDFRNAWSQCDVMLTPATPSAAFGIDDKQDDPIQMYLNDVYTVAVNLAGLPGISVPVATSSQGLPIGAQLLAPPFEEAGLLRAARVLEGLSPN